MKLALVGVGNAGSRIVDRIRAREQATGRRFSDGNLLVFNTAGMGDELDRIPQDRRISIGETNQRIEGQGVDGDLELAVEATREELHDIRRAFDSIEPYDLDGFLLVAGLGGGTGSGAGTVLLDELQSLYEKPIYALGVLPGATEGDRRALNAARALRSIVPKADNAILFDNDAWSPVGGDDEEGYARANRELAIRVTALLGAGELEGARLAENAVDSSDLIRTLATGGVSSIGYASSEVDSGRGGFVAWLRGLLFDSRDAEPADPTEIKRLVRQAVNSKLTLPCNTASAERALIVLSGPPSKLSRRGFEDARYWLEREADTVEVLAGDEPNDRASELTAAVLLSNVTDVPRIEALQERAVQYQAGDFQYE